MDKDGSVHRLAGSSGKEKGGLVIMKKKKPVEDDSMAPPKMSIFGKVMFLDVQQEHYHKQLLIYPSATSTSHLHI